MWKFKFLGQNNNKYNQSPHYIPYGANTNSFLEAKKIA